MTWSLYKKDECLKPLKFSNGKTQEDVVKEVLGKIKEGKKVIFIKGVCGTGKSAIALNIARSLGKASIIVPGKTLQNQYKKDYEGDKYLKKDNGQKLKISVMTGRRNHKCRFLEENKKISIRKEINKTLNDIFSFDEEERKKDESAENPNIPCRIEIKEKNVPQIKAYLKQNNKINSANFTELKEISRAAVATTCPYWSPVLPSKYDLKYFEEKHKKKYEGLSNTQFIIHAGKSGCPFYEQFNAYLDADVIVFNSLKYKFETILNRKPKTEVEIVDECDEFLDSFSNSKTIHVEKLGYSLGQLLLQEKSLMPIISELQEILLYLKNDTRINNAIKTGEIIPIKETGVYDLLKTIAKNPELTLDVDDDNYLTKVEETAKMFEDLLDEAYITITKQEQSILIHVVTTNLEKKFKEMLDKNKVFVLMSGTLHSEEVLKNIFGLTDYSIVDAEVESQGEITIKRSKKEIDCKYSNFRELIHTREQYLRLLDESVKVAKKPCLIHVNAFSDLPSEKEKREYELNNLISQDEIKKNQEINVEHQVIEEFKRGDRSILFSTKVSRGIDFPGEECNSIVFTKYPNPDVSEAFWKILMKTKPQHYWSFYKDKAHRELLQKIYRGLRFKGDTVEVLSPDKRVLDFFENNKI